MDPESTDDTMDPTQDPSMDPIMQDPSYDPSYDPTADPSNYDQAGNYVGPGAYDEQGNWIDPFGQGWQGNTQPGVPIGASGQGGGLGGALRGMSGIGNFLRTGGQAIGQATGAAADSRATQAQLALQGNQQNISGMSASENALLNRAKLEMEQRKQEQRDMARANYMQHPFQSPFAPSPGPQFSSQYMQSMQGLSNQGATDLAQNPIYGARSLPAFQPYSPINIKDIPGATGTTPGVGSTIGSIAGPGMSLLGAFLNRNKPSPQVNQ